MKKKTSISKFVQNNLVLLAIFILVAVTIIVEPNFLTLSNFTNIMRQFGPLSFVSLGMTLVIVGGFLDMSVAGIISLVAVLIVSLIDVIGQTGALIVGLGAGALMGFITSLLILSCGALTSAEALFITFGMSSVYGAIALIYTNAETQHMSWLKTPQTIYTAIGSGTVGFISVSFLMFVVCLVVLFIFQKKTRPGRVIEIMGGNRIAAELAGLPVKKTVMLIYTLSGLMSAIGSVVLFSRITTASPLLGQGYETNAILSVVVGGTSLAGGKGSVLRTMLGVMLVTLLSNCMNLLGVSTYMQTVMKGTILVIAIWLDNRKDK